MIRARCLLLCLAAASAASCVYPRLDGSTAPSHAYSTPEETQGGLRFAELAEEHPGDTALYTLGSGLDAFAVRVDLIDAAVKAVDIQYYIYRYDLTGKILLHRLLAAADRGVRVRFLVDDLGSDGIDDVLAAANVHPHFEVRLFNPRARGNWNWMAKRLDMLRRPLRINRRMHNKLLSGDGIAAIVGGRNIGVAYFDAAEGVNIVDLDVLVLGPVVSDLGDCFDLFWNCSFVERLDGWSPFDRDEADLDELRADLQKTVDDEKGSVYAKRIEGADYVQQAARGEIPLIWAPTVAVSDLPMKIVARGDEVPGTLLMERLKESTMDSTEELLIVSPYFIPGRDGVEFLTGRVAEGVRVRVLTSAIGSSGVPLVHAGYKKYRRGLIEGGVELYELMPRSDDAIASYEQGLFGSQSASLHAKTFVSDRKEVFIGSLNLDPRSVDLNTELGVVVQSEELAGALRAGIERAMAPTSSWRLTVEDGDLVWNGVREGQTLRLTTEPDTTWWTRCKIWMLGLLPIEGQL